MSDADFGMLAALSHDLEKLALALSADRVDGRVVSNEIIDLAAGEREAAAIALSYLLRRRSLGEVPPDPPVLDAAVDAMVTAVRRIAPLSA